MTMSIFDGVFQEGKLEGKQQGKYDGIVTVAKNMLAKDLPIDQVAEFTELPRSTVKKLAAEMVAV